MLNLVKTIAQWGFSILFDLILLPGAGLLCLASLAQIDFNPQGSQIKVGKPPILLLHGSGFNQMEWIIGRWYLRHYQGSVFSLNYDGIVSNDPNKGIDDYAKTKVSDYIRKIRLLTQSRNVILIGHSMGGLIAGYYAEYCAEDDGIKVEKIITIATPWKGTPTLNYTCCSRAKRYQQMSQQDPSHVRRNLVNTALNSQRLGQHHYYTIWSNKDYAVPFQSGCLGSYLDQDLLANDNRQLVGDNRQLVGDNRQLEFNYLGHYAQIIWPKTWKQILVWLNDDC